MKLVIFVVSILLVATAVSLAGTSVRAQEMEVTDATIEAPVDVVDQAASVVAVASEAPIVDAPVLEVPTPTLLPTLVPTSTPAPAAPLRLATAVIDNRFQPTALSIGVGTTVTWTNQGSNTHTLHGLDGQLESGPLLAGQSYSFTFDKAGTYRLICRQHSLNGMAAQVTVQ
jgi:plastocyanin